MCRCIFPYDTMLLYQSHALTKSVGPLPTRKDVCAYNGVDCRDPKRERPFPSLLCALRGIEQNVLEARSLQITTLSIKCLNFKFL